MWRAAAILGYLILACEARLLVALDVETTMILPPSHEIHALKTAEWLIIPLK